MAKRKYSKFERQAYHSGMGYAVRHYNKNIEFKGGHESKGYKSFMAGYRKGVQMIAKAPSKYPNR